MMRAVRRLCSSAAPGSTHPRYPGSTYGAASRNAAGPVTPAGAGPSFVSRHRHTATTAAVATIATVVETAGNPTRGNKAQTDPRLTCFAACSSGPNATVPPAAMYAATTVAAIAPAKIAARRKPLRRQVQIARPAPARAPVALIVAAAPVANPEVRSFPRSTSRIAPRMPSPISASLRPPLTTSNPMTGWSPSHAIAAGERVRRHTSTSAPATANAAVAWYRNLVRAAESPASGATAAEDTVNVGPYTEPVCNQAGETYRSIGSWGYSSGTCRYGLA